jgi:hypothetical protein
MSLSPAVFAAAPVTSFDDRSARLALRATVRSATPRAVREALGRLAATDSDLVLSLGCHLDDARAEHRRRSTARGASAHHPASSPGR